MRDEDFPLFLLRRRRSSMNRFVRGEGRGEEGRRDFNFVNWAGGRKKAEEEEEEAANRRWGNWQVGLVGEGDLPSPPVM